MSAKVAGALVPLEAALEGMLAGLEPLAAEELTLAVAVGRVLAASVRARHTLPPWDNSAMDGFAVRAADVEGAGAECPVSLTVVGEVAAGHVPAVSVVQGTAVRVLTGGMMPPGADAVVPVEQTDAQAGVAGLPVSVAVFAAASPGQHIRRAGSDLAAGTEVLSPGTRVTPAVVAVLAAAGHATALVHRRPVVAILSTGDELVPVGRPLGAAGIPDSNGEALAAQAAANGAQVLRLGIAHDDLDEVRERLRQGVAQADVIVASGGVSVGAHDVVRDAFSETGTLELWRVAIQPGKPLAFGRAPRPDRGTCLFFGLPGNPVSSFVTFELFVRPVLRRMRGERDLGGRPTVRARLDERVSTSAGRRAFLRVRLEPDRSAPGGYRASLSGGQGSHVLSALAAADGLAIVPEDVTELEAGSEVEVLRLDVEVS